MPRTLVEGHPYGAVLRVACPVWRRKLPSVSHPHPRDDPQNALLTAVETLLEACKESVEALALEFGPDVDFVRCKCQSVPALDVSLTDHWQSNI